MNEENRVQEGGAPEADCPECGASGVGGENGCEILFQAVMGREFSRPELFQVHRLTVDAYSLQHPDRYMKSAKSAVAHLVGMCWTMEGSADPSVSRAISRFLDGNPEFRRPRPQPGPGQRGDRTIRYIHEAPDSPEHLRRVREWARGVWMAWSRHHERARQWLAQAQRGGRGE